ncbi:MAG: hypothetical protein IIT38_03385, partial [Bacteroidales bacterium]|nr:hypothetical protein [Bacteroidales bacterium]
NIRIYNPYIHTIPFSIGALQMLIFQRVGLQIRHNQHCKSDTTLHLKNTAGNNITCRICTSL